MKDYHNPNSPLLKDNPTFRGDLAAEDMTKWCEDNSVGQWDIITPDHVRFEFPTDAKQFQMYFWTATVSFDV